MRSINGILLIFLLFVLQYGKIVSYWECMVNPVSLVHCDCETILSGSDHQDGITTTANVTGKILQDYIPFDTTLEEPLPEYNLSLELQNRSEDYLVNGFLIALYHPPENIMVN